MYIVVQMKALVLVTLAATAVRGQSDFTDQATKQFLGMLFAPFGSKPSATAAASAPLYEAASRPLRSSAHHDEPEYGRPTYSLTPPRSYRRPESPYRAPVSSYPRSKSRSGPWISPPEEHWVPPPSHWEPQPWNPPKPKHGAVTIKIRPAAPEEDHHHHHSWEDHSHDHSHDHGHGHGWHIKKKPHYKTVDAKIRIPPVKFRLHVSPKIRIVSGTKDPLERPPPPEPEEHFPWEKPSTGWEKPTWKPPSGWEKYASSGWEKPHSAGWDRPHSSGWDKHHSSGWEKHPSSGWEKHPSSGWDRHPSSGWEKPTRGWERPPSGGWERSSQSGGWEKPAASGWEHYSSSGSWQSPSGGWKPDTSAWDKFATGWDDSHHKHFKPHHRHYPPDYPRYDPKFRIKVHPHINLMKNVTVRLLKFFQKKGHETHPQQKLAMRTTPRTKMVKEKPTDPRFHTIDDERAYKRDHGNKAETTTVDETSSEVASTTPTATQTTPVESDEHNEVTIKKPESSAKPSKVDRDLPLIADPSSPEEVSATGLNA
ncbi:hypothetical protein MRX96_041437 [Rhipicephalus microplus]